MQKGKTKEKKATITFTGMNGSVGKLRVFDPGSSETTTNDE